MLARKLSILRNFFIAVCFGNLWFASQVFAAEGGEDVQKVQSFFLDVVNTLSIFAGSVATIFLLIGGYKMATSSGDTNRLDSAKKTMLYAVVGLVIVIAANVLANIVHNIAASNFQ